MSSKRSDDTTVDTADSDDEYSRAAKRQRLSSPTYDEQVEMSQDIVAAFDAFERDRSQLPRPPPGPGRPSQSLSASGRKKRDSAIALALSQPVLGADLTRSQVPRSMDDMEDDAAGKRFLTGSDDDKPKPSQTTTRSSLFKPASHMALAEGSQEHAQRSSSPVCQPEQDLSDWFQSSHTPRRGSMFQSAKNMEGNDDVLLDEWFTARAPAGATGFQSAKHIEVPKAAADKTATSSTIPLSIYPSFTSGASIHAKNGLSSTHIDTPSGHDAAPAALSGFTSGASVLNPSAKKPNWAMPSEEALRKAAAMMQKWECEEQESAIADADTSFNDEGDSFDPNESPSKPRSTERRLPLASFGPARTVLRDVENASITASGDNSDATASTSAVAAATSASTSGFHVPSFASRAIPGNPKPFKSPMLARVSASTSMHVSSPLNPRASTSAFIPPAPVTPARPSGFAPALASSSSAFTTPFKSSTTGFVTPHKSLGLTPRRTPAGGTKKGGFVTPFKPGFRPGEPGHASLSVKSSPIPYVGIAQPISTSRSKGKQRATFFDLTEPADRQTLAACGLRPQQYTREELEDMGIDISVLEQMSPEHAEYYSFNSAAVMPLLYSTQQPPPATQATLGPEAAFNELKRHGCTLATKQWVTNHWCLILWKLAGMVCLDPAAESDPSRKRWCWPEVMRQLRYRYERELNLGQRPPFRKIVAQDVAASAPMVLCVSSLTWKENGADEDGIPRPATPELEVTDGWYRLRAEIDEPLTRATRKGKIRLGTKIAVMGCRLRTERKDGGEILEMAKSATLQIDGNSCHLVPWHAKLGFQREPFVCTLGSLDSKGGLVASLEVEILKAYPVAYLEFCTDKDGKRFQKGPRNEKEEAIAQEKWEAQREAEAAKLRDEYEETLDRFRNHADQLERKAAPFFNSSHDENPPGNLDDLLLELEDMEDARELVRRISPIECGWLANAAREKVERDEERMHEDIERDLESVCPPRSVRSFRIVLVRDSRTFRRPAQREAQITVWDVLSLQLLEDDKPGDFKSGQRFSVTNLQPSQPSAWMPPREDGSVIYLATRKQSTWTLLGRNAHRT